MSLPCVYYDHYIVGLLAGYVDDIAVTYESCVCYVIGNEVNALVIGCVYMSIRGGPKSDKLFNYINIMVSYKLQNTIHLHCLNNFNI